MPSIIPADRSQLTFMNSLDDMVGPDHPVRLLDGLIDRIINAEADYFDHLAPQDSAGHWGIPAPWRIGVDHQVDRLRQKLSGIGSGQPGLYARVQSSLL
jgi:hypothetical protein